MNKVSKGFFLGSVATGWGIGAVLIALGLIQIRTGDPESGLRLLVLSNIPMLYGTIARSEAAKQSHCCFSLSLRGALAPKQSHHCPSMRLPLF